MSTLPSFVPQLLSFALNEEGEIFSQRKTRDFGDIGSLHDYVECQCVDILVTDRPGIFTAASSAANNF